MLVFVKLDNYWTHYLPYAFLYMGFHLKKRQIPYKILHNTISTEFQKDKKAFLNNIKRLRPEIVAFSVITGRQTKDSAEFSMQLKRHLPDVKIVWGGYHPTILPEQCIKQDYIDYVLQGEADLTICDFYEAIASNTGFEKIPGCWWKEGSEIFHSNLPLPKVSPQDTGLDFSQVRVEKYFNHHGGLSIITSRGCPYNCQFCINQSLDNKKWRPASVDSVKETIDFFHSKGIQHLHVNDDNFYVDFDRAVSLLEYANVPSFSEIRITTLLKHDRIQVLSKLKCQKLLSGGESCDNDILRKIGKGQTFEQMLQAAALFKEHENMQPSWSFILGMPVETLENVYTTIKGKEQLDQIWGGSIGNVGIYVPYPGSPMYAEALAKGFREPSGPLEWGCFERYGFDGRKSPPTHEEYPWINIKDIWELALKDYKKYQKGAVFKALKRIRDQYKAIRYKI